MVSDYSAQHDIMLIHSLGNLKKITNVYSEKELIGTSDSILCKWFEGYLKKEYNSDFTNLISLEKLNLIFWIESDKASGSDYLANSWMYITDTIVYLAF
jgi:hypothetical protein